MKRILHFIWPPRFAYVGLYTHFSQVLTHEIGHSLGLLHSNVRSSIMWPYQQNMRDPKLGDNDIWRIQRHYGTGAGIGVVKTLSRNSGGQVGWRVVQSPEQFSFFMFCNIGIWHINTKTHSFTGNRIHKIIAKSTNSNNMALVENNLNPLLVHYLASDNKSARYPVCY